MDAKRLAESNSGAPSEVAIELSKGTANALVGQPTEVVDSLGRRHRRDAGGRFCRKDGTVDDNQLLPNIDGRSLAYKRFKQIVARILVDHADGQVSEAMKILIMQYAAAAILAEQLNIAIARGERVSVQEHALLSSSLKRLSASIGVGREAKVVSQPKNAQEYRAHLDALAAKAEQR